MLLHSLWFLNKSKDYVANTKNVGIAFFKDLTVQNKIFYPLTSLLEVSSFSEPLCLHIKKQNKIQVF